MVWISAAAIYFVLWWLVLFAVLPFSLRTQDENGGVTLGTVRSAPRGPHVLRALIRTTWISATLFALIWMLIFVTGFSFEDLPHIVPEFN